MLSPALDILEVRCPVEGCGRIVRMKSSCLTRGGAWLRRSPARRFLARHIDRAHFMLNVHEKSLVLDRELETLGL